MHFKSFYYNIMLFSIFPKDSYYSFCKSFNHPIIFMIKNRLSTRAYSLISVNSIRKALNPFSSNVFFKI